MNTIRNVKKMYNLTIEIEGVLLTMYVRKAEFDASGRAGSEKILW